MPNIPVVNLGEEYVNDLVIGTAVLKTIVMSAGAARNSTNVNDIVLAAAATIDGGTVGANGVDIAVIIASTFYAVHVIGDSTGFNATAGLLSLSLTDPSLPAGYDMFRRVGFVLTDATPDILLFYQYGTGVVRKYYYDVGISELSAGAATTFTEINLATSVPAIVTEVLFDAVYTPNGATDIAALQPFGSSASNGMINMGYGVAAAQQGNIIVPTGSLDSGVPKILYKVTSGDTLTLLTVGYTDYL